MADYKEYTAKTVDEAITQACLDLGVTSDRLDYEVKQEATGGFLGLGAKPAVISARARTEEELEAEKRAIEEAEKADTRSVVTEAFEKKPEKQQDKKEIEFTEEEIFEVEMSSDNNEEGIITSDEIEKRAAAAAKAKNAGHFAEAEERPSRGGRKSSREGTRDRRRSRERRDMRGGRDRRREKEFSYEHHEPSKPKPERVVKPISEEEAKKLTDAAEHFLASVFEAMSIDAQMEISYSQSEGCVSVVIAGEEMGILIGKRGQTLDSLQYLTSLVVNRESQEYVRVKLDTEDYRARRADTLTNLARNIAFKVRKSHRPIALEPMNPYERRIIHSALQGNPYVETYSEGEEPYRHVVVAPKQ